MKKHLKPAAPYLIALIAFVGAIWLVVYDEAHRDHEKYALSFGFTERGAKSFAEACDSVPRHKWPAIEKWASENPYDVSEETRNGCSVVGCIARDAAIRQREEAEARYLAEMAKIRRRALSGDSFTPEEKELWGEVIAEAKIELAMRKQRELEEERRRNWPPPGYYPALSTGP